MAIILLLNLSNFSSDFVLCESKDFIVFPKYVFQKPHFYLGLCNASFGNSLFVSENLLVLLSTDDSHIEDVLDLQYHFLSALQMSSFDNHC